MKATHLLACVDLTPASGVTFCQGTQCYYAPSLSPRHTIGNHDSMWVSLVNRYLSEACVVLLFSPSQRLRASLFDLSSMPQIRATVWVALFGLKLSVKAVLCGQSTWSILLRLREISD